MIGIAALHPTTKVRSHSTEIDGVGFISPSRDLKLEALVAGSAQHRPLEPGMVDSGPH